MATLSLPTFGDLNVAAAEEVSERFGDMGRAFSGKMRSDTRSVPRVWSITTSEYSAADAESIRDELTGTPPLACSGTLLADSGTVNVHPRQVRRTPLNDAGSLVYVLTFELHESEPA